METVAATQDDNKHEDLTFTEDLLDVELYLDEDVYNFYLLYRETAEYKKLNLSKIIKIKFIVSLCFFIQLGLVLLLQFMPQSNYDSATMDASVNCNTFDAKCTITENKYAMLYNKQITFTDACARVLSSALIMGYIYPNIVSVPVYAVKYLHTRHISWVLIGIFQIFTLCLVAFRVTEVVYKSTSVFEALSSGIGFIIVIEVDNILFNTAFNNRRFNIPKDLFYIKLKNRDVQNTIYSKLDVDAYDLLLFCSSTLAILTRTIMACSWYSFGFRSESVTYWSSEEWTFNIVTYIPIVWVLIVGWAPFFFVWRAVCCKRNH